MRKTVLINGVRYNPGPQYCRGCEYHSPGPLGWGCDYSPATDECANPELVEKMAASIERNREAAERRYAFRPKD